MQIHKSDRASLIESLRDPEEAAAYLNTVFEDGDIEPISLALKDVAEAQKSIVAEGSSSEDTDWEKCYQLLTEAQIPELPTLMNLLSKLGLKLSITHEVKQAA